MTFRPPRSSKVIEFGANQKRACDFLLIRHSNLGPILHRFGDVAGCAPDPTPFHPNFRGAPIGRTRSSMLGSARGKALSYSAVELFSKYANQCDNHT